MKTYSFALVALVLASAGAHALNFKTNLQQVRLPTTSERSVPVSSASIAVGTMVVSGKLMCGDGDVENYYQESAPHFDVVIADNDVIEYNSDHTYSISITSGKTPIYTTVGYWVVPDGAAPIPTKDNFNAVGWGYLTASPDGDRPMELLFPMSNSTYGNPDMLGMLRREVEAVQGLADKPFGYSANYRLYMGVFACLNPQDQAGNAANLTAPASGSPLPTYVPSNAEIVSSLVNADSAQIMQSYDASTWTNSADISNFFSSYRSVSVNKVRNSAMALTDSARAPGNPVTFQVATSGQAPLSGSAFSLAQSIATVAYPTFPDYDAALAAAQSATRALADARNELDAKTEALNTADAGLASAQTALNAATTEYTQAQAATQATAVGTPERTSAQNTEDAKLAAKNSAQSAFDSAQSARNTALSKKNAAQTAYNDASAANSSAQSTLDREENRRPSIYRAYLASNISVPSGLLSSSRLSSCNADLGFATSTGSPTYRWENFPINVSCRALDARTAYDQLMSPSGLPTPAQFTARKKALARPFILAAALEAAQTWLQTASSYTVKRAHCFYADASRTYIDKLIASYPLELKYDTATNAYKIDYTLAHAHPEPGFAISNSHFQYSKNIIEVTPQTQSYEGYSYTYNSYRDTGVANPNANASSVYCQVYGDKCDPAKQLNDWKASGALIPINNSTLIPLHRINSDTFQVPLNLQLKIRSLSRGGYACSGVWFC